MSAWERLRQIKAYLSQLQNIPDMGMYAETWRLLATEYLILGATANAEYCQARADHYGQMSAGEYVRLFDGPVAELIGAE